MPAVLPPDASSSRLSYIALFLPLLNLRDVTSRPLLPRLWRTSCAQCALLPIIAHRVKILAEKSADGKSDFFAQPHIGCLTEIVIYVIFYTSHGRGLRPVSCVWYATVRTGLGQFRHVAGVGLMGGTRRLLLRRSLPLYPPLGNAKPRFEKNCKRESGLPPIAGEEKTEINVPVTPRPEGLDFQRHTIANIRKGLPRKARMPFFFSRAPGSVFL
jgi:hypothetical protein